MQQFCHAYRCKPKCTLVILYIIYFHFTICFKYSWEYLHWKSIHCFYLMSSTSLFIFLIIWNITSLFPFFFTKSYIFSVKCKKMKNSNCLYLFVNCQEQIAQSVKLEDQSNLWTNQSLFRTEIIDSLKILYDFQYSHIIYNYLQINQLKEFP